MYLPDRDLNLDGTAQTLFSNLEKLRLALNLSHRVWADLQGLTVLEYEKTYLSNRKELPYLVVHRICEHFGLSFELLTDPKKFDAYATARQYYGEVGYVPEKYSAGAFSRRLTMRNILEAVGNAFGQREVQKILRTLQVQPWALAEAYAPINIKFATDMLGMLGTNDPAYFASLGAYTVAKNAGHAFTLELKKARTVSELYQAFLEEHVRVIDRNSLYKYIRLNELQFITEARQNEEVVEALKDKRYGSVRGCHFKTGVIAHLPHYVGARPINVTKIGCIHQGDATCRWLCTIESEAFKLSS